MLQWDKSHNRTEGSRMGLIAVADPDLQIMGRGGGGGGHVDHEIRGRA